MAGKVSSGGGKGATAVRVGGVGSAKNRVARSGGMLVGSAAVRTCTKDMVITKLVGLPLLVVLTSLGRALFLFPPPLLLILSLFSACLSQSPPTGNYKCTDNNQL